MTLKIKRFFFAVLVGLLLASPPAKAQSSPQESAPQGAAGQGDVGHSDPAQIEDSSQPLIESPVVPAGDGAQDVANESGPPSLPPAQRYQSEIFVLRSQAEGFIAQAEAHEEISPELQSLITEVKEVVAATAQVKTLFDVSRLEVLRDQLLDAPLRLYQAATTRPEPRPPSVPPTAKDRVTPRPRPLGATSPPLPAHLIPPQLRHGGQAYFGGDYQGAIDTLSTASFAAPRSQALALLLRAAARYSLFLTADEQEESQLAVVRAEIRECARLAPRLRPDPDLFSPRFVHFFDRLSGARRLRP